MFEKLFQLLQSKHAGVRKDGLRQLARSLALQVETEEEATEIVEKLTDEKVSNFVKEFRSEVDKEVSEGNKTFETNLKKKYDLKPKGQKTTETVETPKEEEGGPTDIAAIIREEVNKALAPLQQEKTFNTRFQQLKEHAEKCKDETLKSTLLGDFRLMNFESDEQFNEHLENVSQRVEQANQTIANSALNSMGTPIFSEKAPDGVSSSVTSFIEEQKEGGGELSGKEV